MAMETIIFDGKKVAARRHAAVRESVKTLVNPATGGVILPTLTSLFFREDQGSVLYTKLKRQAAVAAGFAFADYSLSIRTSRLADITATLKKLAADSRVTGIIIQKPTQAVWQVAYSGELTFDEWWHELTGALAVPKDVDCLTQTNLRQLRSSPGGILPATVKAVWLVLEAAGAGKSLPDLNVAIVGCSDIIGLPLADVLERHGCSVTRHCETIDVAALAAAEVVISATGKPHSITGRMIRPGAIVIDVGAPRGDVETASVIGRACFLSPVPGGVGPVTVVCLLENTLDLLQQPVYAARPS